MLFFTLLLPPQTFSIHYYIGYYFSAALLLLLLSLHYLTYLFISLLLFHFHTITLIIPFFPPFFHYFSLDMPPINSLYYYFIYLHIYYYISLYILLNAISYICFAYPTRHAIISHTAYRHAYRKGTTLMSVTRLHAPRHVNEMIPCRFRRACKIRHVSRGISAAMPYRAVKVLLLWWYRGVATPPRASAHHACSEADAFIYYYFIIVCFTYILEEEISIHTLFSFHFSFIPSFILYILLLLFTYYIYYTIVSCSFLFFFHYIILLLHTLLEHTYYIIPFFFYHIIQKFRPLHTGCCLHMPRSPAHRFAPDAARRNTPPRTRRTGEFFDDEYTASRPLVNTYYY